MNMDEVMKHYVATRVLPDGRMIGVHQLLYHWTMHVDINEYGYEDRYCFWTRGLAVAAMETWDGTGDPINWHKHPATDRIRNVITGEITYGYVERTQ